ncbi:GNAT family N-acetyltransferase [Hymenobacter latericus]|uniref:GNAT family N-acetyltransferase n=1 Tax=Hymenobacter sp. YIM 151858-1 TaxID=2987688 RepID=UPI002227D277|nr:GNAT family N-acetyltransferase [Hymenobacter sp. YIM 151858-1]UYZ57955.1 GNAT family N-acetyltransferase [Hymenobacter sp. YIM 151858-1]
MTPADAAFAAFPELRTAGLRLRAVTTADLEAVRPITFYDGLPAASLAQTERMLARIEEDYRNRQSIHWAVALADSDELIGTCGFYRGFAGACGEIGYVLRPEYRGQGLMTQAVQAICAFGFGQLQLRQIEAYTEPDNLASQRLLTRTGFAPAASDVPGLLRYALPRGPARGRT